MYLVILDHQEDLEYHILEYLELPVILLHRLNLLIQLDQQARWNPLILYYLLNLLNQLHQLHQLHLLILLILLDLYLLDLLYHQSHL
jgi:hypothetical protein